LQTVQLSSGEILSARLVVLASGGLADIPLRLGLKKTFVQRSQSVALGFTLARTDGSAFEFDSATCYPVRKGCGIDYLTLFRINRSMRANLFAFPQGDESWVRSFLGEPDKQLRVHFPGLRNCIGDHQVVGRVETVLIHLYRTQGEPPPGVVLIGDAFQNACPSTGMGVSKVLTDVDVFCCECVPRWFASPGMGADKMTEFWCNPRKIAMDSQALQDAAYRRSARTNGSIRWKIYRATVDLSM
jgi:2-polyprenyl-6-methoxyphenol hydroxylase-like FAD-dependent oxidoreductase